MTLPVKVKNGPTNTKRSMAGFSLVELTVLMVVIGIMLALAVPNVRSTIDTFQVRTAAAEMATNIRLVGQQSISHEKEYKIKFDCSSDRYMVYWVKEDGTTELVETVALENGVGIESTTFLNDEITFGVQGRPSSAGVIELRSSAGIMRSVSVDSSGRVAAVN